MKYKLRDYVEVVAKFVDFLADSPVIVEEFIGFCEPTAEEEKMLRDLFNLY